MENHQNMGKKGRTIAATAQLRFQNPKSSLSLTLWSGAEQAQKIYINISNILNSWCHVITYHSHYSMYLEGFRMFDFILHLSQATIRNKICSKTSGSVPVQSQLSHDAPPNTIQSSQSHPKYFEMWFQSPRFLLKYPKKIWRSLPFLHNFPLSYIYPINIPYVFLDISHKTSRRTPKQSTNVPFTSMVFTIKTTSNIPWQDCCPDISHQYIILYHISHVYS